ncbi:MAG: hypothetical protein IPK77_04285 [Cellvibrio sp.]|nr:hypothetical protein [Cellvibrio sp.]
MSKTLVSGKETNPSPYKRGAFAIEDLTLQTGSDFRNRVIERSYTTDYSWIRRAAIKAPQFVSEALWDNAPTALYLEESRNLVLDDVVIDAHNCVLGRVLVSYLRVQNSKMTWFGRHFGIAARSHNVLLTNNALTQRAGTGDPTGLNLTTFHGDPDFGGPFSRDFLLARNTSTREATSIPIKRSQGYTLGRLERHLRRQDRGRERHDADPCGQDCQPAAAGRCAGDLLVGGRHCADRRRPRGGSVALYQSSDCRRQQRYDRPGLGHSTRRDVDSRDRQSAGAAADGG